MSLPTLTYELHHAGRAENVEIAVRDLVLAGWTGRDRAALERHIAEMEALGVRRPPSIPVFYRVAAARLSTADAIEVSGADSSGEVEFVLLQSAGALWVGTGSDHTDRKVESYNITVSKQMYEKPMPRQIWDYAEIAGHWDRLVLRAWTITQGKAELYQEDPVSAMLAPAELIAGYTGGNSRLAEGTVMFSGTIATRGGGLRPSERFRFELEDPVLGRTLRHEYGVRNLPVLG